MESVRMCFVMAVFGLVMALLLPSINAQGPAAAPAPSNDGASIDQGVAYVLMVVALALTYIIH
ncbi:putative arabinogalactan protein/22/41 [Helianthus annuus]|uniref:Arabinogalactan protein 16/20/22/41 n=1 Tax=Helianthus annuus TaxID=4232 RepID=A0A251TQ99_HELAN|nr:putative arabinogalactan protein 16/20/22/41 [Helianthus annuus]KAJ0515591.1 putative arabinogalactan protein/22/41 [Helianthus annuus]KAJ0524150.1 putative arabinogalactan protein/22/41 [Helianthus annuus]KAJ0531771.1 putative arabinogalactan protein/22/41 [Helianthus annuus]KAJ0885785.1 putative arabinogalactan protein/22/41 [Helianthus annuus]